MKNLIIVALFCAASSSAFSQVTVNGKDINKMEDVYFVELTATNKAFSTKVKILIDYGQKIRLAETQSIKTSDGKSMSFESVVGALNFMAKNGWEYVNSFPVAMEGGDSVSLSFEEEG
ncbi:MAG TPA: hypothetical protein ENJ95_01660 [Bacteroidetes bacterium]|nr:hypothetical protein [Bacteroidota bacterium]